MTREQLERWTTDLRTRRASTAELERWRDELRRQPQPNVEARVLRAVITEPEKLAIAHDTETEDFQHPGNRKAFTHVRALEASGAEVDIDAVCEADEMERITLKHGTEGTGAMIRHLHEHVFTLAPMPYELVFGFDAALGVFEADRYQLRLIADARRAA